MSDKAPTVEELRQSVEGGVLWLEPGTAEKCAGRAEALRDGLRSTRRSLIATEQLSGFGGFGSGDALRAQFVAKATEAIDYIDRQIAIAANMAETFRAAGRAYANQEATNAAAISAVEVGQPR
ncbi:hypothetical protein [Antrihabitans stalactiti]|uniref:hypothetical protein n=1 Tax=Antrihabitans stalactiti TaxID=2584121 RepID=UPI00146ADFDA|nr:hypothetical protein [Antrihabitans stalactiti]